MKMSLLSPSGFLQRKQASKKWGWWSSYLESQYLADLGEDTKDERLLKLPLLAEHSDLEKNGCWLPENPASISAREANPSSSSMKQGLLEEESSMNSIGIEVILKSRGNLLLWVSVVSCSSFAFRERGERGGDVEKKERSLICKRMSGWRGVASFKAEERRWEV